MGLPRPRARALALATPTSSAPASPGPLVTATASMSFSAMPAVSTARSIVGTIASRWARLATSGTTPPKRAWSSTLLATVSARRVWPRTMPTPVSSQEVSIPRTSGSSVMGGRRGGAGGAGEPAAHHQRLGPVTVVVGTHVDDAELAGDVEAEGGGVGHAHLQQHARGTVGVDEQLVEQARGDAAAARVGAYADPQQVDDVARGHRDRVARQVVGDDEASSEALDLLTDELLAPRVGPEELLLEGGERREVGEGGGTDHETGFLGAPATASGRRR